MRTDLAAHVEREFHFIQRPLEVGGGNGFDHGGALVTDNIGVVPPDDPVQAAAAIRIAKIGMGKCSAYDLLVVHVISLVDRSRLPLHSVADVNTENGFVAVFCPLEMTWAVFAFSTLAFFGN